MRGKKAKLLRRQIYGGDFSPREKKYSLIRRIKKALGLDKCGREKVIDRVTGQVVCVGRRAAYQKLKRQSTRRNA